MGGAGKPARTGQGVRLCIRLWEELLHWEPSELFGFYYDTRVWYGSLAALRERFGPSDARRAVRIGACGSTICAYIYRLHEKAGSSRAVNPPFRSARGAFLSDGRVCCPPVGASAAIPQGRNG